MALRVLAIANLPCELRADLRAVYLLTIVPGSTNCLSERLWKLQRAGEAAEHLV
jgi:hypothetical protein